MFWKIFCVTFLVPFFTIPVHAMVEFEDVSELAGISYQGFSWGSAWGDFNGDGWPDLWTSNHGKTPNLYLNNGNGSFTDISPQLNLERFVGRDIHGSSWADFDNDGDQDLIILTGAERGVGSGSNIFLINHQGNLEDNASFFGLDYPLGRGRTPLWFDYDKNGLLDIILANFPRPDGLAPTVLFAQNSTGFHDITQTTGMNFSNPISSVQLSDLSGDRKLDLIFMRPFSEGIYDYQKIPFINFLDTINLPRIWSNDLAIGDFNGDLRSDFFLARVAFEGSNITDSGNFSLNDKLLINTPEGFEDKSFSSGLGIPTSCRSAVTADFDNDMDLDIFLVCGSYSENLPNILYENLGDATFLKIPKAAGADGSIKGIGDTVTTVDFDSDGFIDLFITNGFGTVPANNNGPSQIYRNLGNENHWLEIDLVGTISNKDGIGTSILISAGGVKQLREVNGGIHHAAQNHKRIHFGLEKNSIISNIVLFWPSGMVNEMRDIKANQILTIIEPTLPMPPNHQTRLGIEPEKVKCREGFELIMKLSNGQASCVKSTSINSLKERGWGI